LEVLKKMGKAPAVAEAKKNAQNWLTNRFYTQFSIIYITKSGQLRVFFAFNKIVFVLKFE
jgi:hypothetical protein